MINLLKKHIADIITGLFIIIFVIVTMDYNKYNPIDYSRFNTSSITYAKAEVINAVSEETVEDSLTPGRYLGVQTLYIRIKEGELKGNEYVIDNYLSTTHNVRLASGEQFIACIDRADAEEPYITVYNYNRAPNIFLGIGAFMILLIIIGRGKGFKTIVSIAFALYSIIRLMIPMIFNGYSPVWTSIGIIIINAAVTLFLLNGISRKTTVAFLSTGVGILLSGIIFSIWSSAVNVSGYNTDQAEGLILISSNTGLKIEEVLFGGVLISCFGAVMDVAVSLAAALDEIGSKCQTISFRELFRSGIKIGKDMIGTMSNTLIYAFAGETITMILILYSYNISFVQLINSDFLSEKILSGLSGTFGVVLTVLVSSVIGAWYFRRCPEK